MHGLNYFFFIVIKLEIQISWQFKFETPLNGHKNLQPPSFSFKNIILNTFNRSMMQLLLEKGYYSV